MKRLKRRKKTDWKMRIGFRSLLIATSLITNTVHTHTHVHPLLYPVIHSYIGYLERRKLFGRSFDTTCERRKEEEEEEDDEGEVKKDGRGEMRDGRRETRAGRKRNHKGRRGSCSLHTLSHSPHTLSLSHTHTHTHTRTLHRVGAYLVTFLHAFVVSHKVTPPAAAFTSAICRFKEEGRMFKPILVLMAAAFTSAIFRFHSDEMYTVSVYGVNRLFIGVKRHYKGVNRLFRSIRCRCTVLV